MNWKLIEYAHAVPVVGPGAALTDDAVLDLHDCLALVNPRRIRVALPHPLPGHVTLPPTVEVVQRQLAPEDMTDLEGIPAMTVTAALLACRGRGMTERLLQGVQRALENNLIGPPTARFLRIEFKERQQ